MNRKNIVKNYILSILGVILLKNSLVVPKQKQGKNQKIRFVIKRNTEIQPSNFSKTSQSSEIQRSDRYFSNQSLHL